MTAEARTTAKDGRSQNNGKGKGNSNDGWQRSAACRERIRMDAAEAGLSKTTGFSGIT
jgi:hypothetical protein